MPNGKVENKILDIALFAIGEYQEDEAVNFSKVYFIFSEGEAEAPFWKVSVCLIFDHNLSVSPPPGRPL